MTQITGIEIFSLTLRRDDAAIEKKYDDTGKMKAVKMVSGAQPYANFKAAIDEILSSKK